MKIVMGADAEEILTQDKPLLEHYLKGFSVTIDVVFLKQIKKALLAGLEGTQIGEKNQGRPDDGRTSICA